MLPECDSTVLSARLELVKGVAILSLIAFTNAILTWHFRHATYRRYLRIKYRVKNKLIFPIIFRHHVMHQRME